MNSSIKTVSTFIIVLLTMVSCKKVIIKTAEDYRIKYGNVTFGCFINGVPWVPNYGDPGSGVGPVSISNFASGSPSAPFFYTVIEALSNYERLTIYLPNDIIEKKYLLNYNSGIYPTNNKNLPSADFTKYYPYSVYTTNQNTTGYVNVTTVKYGNGGKIEGTFECELTLPSTNEKLLITNGYFKRQY